LGSTSSQKNREQYELKSIIRSKDKQLGHLQSHLKVLETTIELLKSEGDALAKENKALLECQGADKVECQREVK
jgi:hypothetical protein